MRVRCVDSVLLTCFHKADIWISTSCNSMFCTLCKTTLQTNWNTACTSKCHFHVFVRSVLHAANWIWMFTDHKLCSISRGVTKGGQIPREPIDYGGAPNHCGSRRKVPTMSQVLCSIQQICFRKSSGSTIGEPNFDHGAPVRPRGRQTCLLLRAPSNLVTPLSISPAKNSRKRVEEKMC